MKEKKDIKILVIDDEEDVRRVTVAMLASFGYQSIFQASSGEEGINLTWIHHPDLVVTDLTMLGMRGEKMIRRIVLEYKPDNPQIKIIALSGDDQEIMEPVVKAAGGDGFLSKPFASEDLKRMAADLLNQAVETAQAVQA